MNSHIIENTIKELEKLVETVEQKNIDKNNVKQTIENINEEIKNFIDNSIK